MDDDILASIDELLNIATTEEEIEYVMSLYDEYTEKSTGDTIDDLLEDVEDEEDLRTLIETVDNGLGEVDFTKDEEQSEFETTYYEEGEEEDIKPGREEDSWETEDDFLGIHTWMDKNEVEHHIIKGEPAQGEFRQVFDFPEDAINYTLEIGAGASYFDVFDTGVGFEVWFVG